MASTSVMAETALVVEEESPVETDSPRLDRRRYRRTLRFFAGMVANLVWWELILRRVVGRGAVSRSRPKRLRRYARNFREMAVQMGGVMIKLGQFFSARLDVLPPEITGELAGLQDEVPPEPFEALRPLFERELGPLDQTFAWFDEDAHAAASLGQVHRARLQTGERVVVKVQRPGIRQLVATDLAALNVVGKWAMRYKAIRRRADVPALLDEFARTLWEELDYVAEADNAEHFGNMFASHLGVYVPAVYRDYSTACVLTLEDVTSIKITDHDAIDASGVDRREAAARLFDLYMTQIFDHRFFHADPHPGNLFVYPWPPEAYGESPDGLPNGSRPFYLVFVDFGMVGRIKDNVVEGLREAIIAIVTRDSDRLINAYETLGALLPQADRQRIAQAERQVLDRVWGMKMQQLKKMHATVMREFVEEFGDLLYEMPFQVPQDLIYLGRAVGILSGMCTSLDPDFNAWTAITPYAQKFAEEELRLNRVTLLEGLRQFGKTALDLPRRAGQLLGRAERGELSVLTAPDPAAQRQQRHLETAINHLTTGVVFSSLVLAGTILLVNGERILGLAGYGLALVSFALLFRRRQVNI